MLEWRMWKSTKKREKHDKNITLNRMKDREEWLQVKRDVSKIIQGEERKYGKQQWETLEEILRKTTLEISTRLLKIN